MNFLDSAFLENSLGEMIFRSLTRMLFFFFIPSVIFIASIKFLTLRVSENDDQSISSLNFIFTYADISWKKNKNIINERWCLVSNKRIKEYEKWLKYNIALHKAAEMQWISQLIFSRALLNANSNEIFPLCIDFLSSFDMAAIKYRRKYRMSRPNNDKINSFKEENFHLSFY